MPIKNKPKRFWLLLLVAFSACTLFACSDEERIKDLQTYVDTLKKALIKHKKVDYFSTFTQPVPVLFQSANFSRDPFVEEVTVYNGEAIRDPVQAFPLKSYIFEGTISRDAQTIAVIQAPDNKVYQLRLNDRIGNSYGRIIAIHKDYLEVEEKVTSQEEQLAGQGATKRIVDLQLKGAN